MEYRVNYSGVEMILKDRANHVTHESVPAPMDGINKRMEETHNGTIFKWAARHWVGRSFMFIRGTGKV